MKVFLKPGEMYLGEESAEVSTILGSCVSVTMFCRRSGSAQSAMPSCPVAVHGKTRAWPLGLAFY